MANWAWPHTPSSNMARLVLADGPFAGEEVSFLPPDISPPAQVVWSGWSPQGFTAWLYEWHGERTIDRGRTDALVYRCTGRRLGPDEVPPVVAESAELWADGANMVSKTFGVSADVLWPGL